MKWNLILQSKNYSLLQNETDSQYVVANGYDPEKPENNQWNSGFYFGYANAKDKVKALSHATELLRFYTEENFIPRSRIEELATNFKDALFSAYLEDREYDEFFLEECDMTENELEFFGIDIDREDDEEDD